MKKDRTYLKLMFIGLIFIISLLSIMTILVLATNRTLLNQPDLISEILSIYLTSGIVYMLLIFALLIAIPIMIKMTPEIRSSILIKDNTLRYETLDENNKKVKRTFHLDNINKYLSERKEINIIDDLKLYKDDKKKALNINTLMVKDKNNKELSLKKLAQNDIEKYNRICEFLDKISDKDDIELDFRLRRYVKEQNMADTSKDIIQRYENLIKQTKDIQIKKEIETIIQRLKYTKKHIDEVSDLDRLRKLYENYLPIYEDILKNYFNIESHEKDELQLNKTRNEINQISQTIIEAFNTMFVEDKQTSIEANVANLEKIEKESKSLLKELEDS